MKTPVKTVKDIRLQKLKRRAQTLAIALGAYDWQKLQSPYTGPLEDDKLWFANIYCPQLLTTFDSKNKYRTEAAALRGLIELLEARLRAHIMECQQALDGK